MPFQGAADEDAGTAAIIELERARHHEARQRSESTLKALKNREKGTKKNKQKRFEKAKAFPAPSEPPRGATGVGIVEEDNAQYRVSAAWTGKLQRPTVVALCLGELDCVNLLFIYNLFILRYIYIVLSIFLFFAISLVRFSFLRI